MIIGAAVCECILYDAQSLKDKRAIIKSILSKAKQRYNLSASEIDFQNVWQRSKFAFVSVGTSRVQIERELHHALALIDQRTDIERTVTSFEWL